MRNVVIATLVIILSGFLLMATLESLSFFQALPPTSQHYVQNATVETGVINMVTAVLFDYRGFDTLGEALVIFTAVGTIALLFMARRFPYSDEGLSPIVRTTMTIYTPFMLLFGFYIILFGHISPGGGFQGGVILGSIILVHLLAYGSQYRLSLFNPELLRQVEAWGAIGMIVLASLPLLVGDPFLANLQSIFSAGRLGTIASAGHIPIFNLLVGIKVAAGVALIVYSMIRMPEGGQ